MNFEDLSEDVRRATVTIEGMTPFWVDFDANKYVGACYRRMAEHYRRQAGAEADAVTDLKTFEALAERFEQAAVRIDLDREMYADVLAEDRYGIIKAWDQRLKSGEYVAPNFENLMRVPSGRLREIFRQCREAPMPKKTETAEDASATTSSTISDGSSSPDTHTPESQIM